ncbi:MAG: hypothetical protein AB1544_02235 [Pseudomonadota bacterium]|jgi:hypothetical protein
MAAHAFIVVIPVADRPRHIQACLTSLRAALQRFPYAGRIRVLLADDSAAGASIEANRAIARRFSADGLEVIHFPPAEQYALVSGLGLSLPRVLGDAPSERYGHKGQGVMRNIAYLKVAELIKDASADTLIWSIDSDQEFRVNVPADGGYVVDFFNGIDAIFTQTEAQVLTGKVVGDPPVSPAVMTRNFLDDVLAFLARMAERDPAAACDHHAPTPAAGDAAYHDMAELFGFKPADNHAYPCPLHGAHTEADCFANFAGRVNSFFYGEHPTRISGYVPGDLFASVQPARTVYAGNYVFRPAALEYFIPFATLRLRMSGPTLGRIVKSELGPRFVSANLPMLHKRTVESGGQSEFRPGIETTQATIDMSGEFERQFYGDVMLFAVERLAGECRALSRPASADFGATLDALREEMLNRYNERQQAILHRLDDLDAHLADPARWWNLSPEQAAGFRQFAANVRRNFGAASSGHARINDAANWTQWRGRLLDALAHYREDRAAWSELI